MPLLRSLLLVEERLSEADYFARRLRSLRGETFQYELNAFLSAARSVTWLLQKELTHVDGFKEWWSNQQKEMAADQAMRFFLELRNYSQKEGRISMVGGSVSGQHPKQWSYRFAGTKTEVPAALLHRDVAECCREHVAKLARVVLACSDAFPYHSCPRRALTVEGLETLGIELSEVVNALGFPPEWLKVAGIQIEQQLRILREHVDGLDFSALQKLTRPRQQRANTRGDSQDFGSTLLRHTTEAIERKRN